MTEFRDMYGAVYILENVEAKRVKVGMTINATSNIYSRLDDVNNIWLGKKATCQICGARRFVNENGLMPSHVTSGIPCFGEKSLPIEQDITLAESHLSKLKEIQKESTGDKKGSITRVVNNLENRINKNRQKREINGIWLLRVAYLTDKAEHIELETHKLLNDFLDLQAPLGEVFSCPVSLACKIIEKVLSENNLNNAVKKLEYG